MENREFTRVPPHFEADVTAGDTRIQRCQTEDVSMKGAYLKTPRALPRGTECRVTLYLGGPEGGPRIEADAKVTRSDERGFAVEFLRLDLDSYTHLEKLVRYNASDLEQVEDELKSHLGIARRRDTDQS